MLTSKLVSIAVFATVALTACGGGVTASGSGSSTSPATPAASGTYVPNGNAATVQGIDSAGRGYRDDVAQLISDSYSAVPTVKVGAELAAQAYQASLSTAAQAMSDTTPMIEQEAQIGGCAARNAGLSNAQALITAEHAIYARTFNTDARMAARQKYAAKATTAGVLPFDPTKCASIVGGAR
ncbi:hypothetical protein P3T20_004713 [Paraburkholderia sp. GAS206C]|jgi:hypothetical protein|uniref:hypothetical protein n=1 Tax=unclassified Paraburkholderia TaxID=2615204 RepID=UPI003D1B7282